MPSTLQALGLRLLDREPLLVHEPLVVLGPDLVVLVLDVVQVVLGAGPGLKNKDFSRSFKKTDDHKYVLLPKNIR